MERDMQSVNTPLYRITASVVLLAASSLLLHSPARATDQADQRRDARDTRQDTRQDSRKEKVDCRKEDNKSNAACRQENRDNKQEGRKDARDIKY